MSTNIFLSHRSEDRDIAENLRYHIEYLSDNTMTVHVCHRMQGGDDWRSWIHETIPECTMFIFIYTGPAESWTWCIFEAGLFRGRYLGNEARLLAMRSPKAGDVPAPLEDLQAIEASKGGVRNFLIDLIEKDNSPAKTDKSQNLVSNKSTELNDAAIEIEGLFAKDKKTVDFFSRRIEIYLSDRLDHGRVPSSRVRVSEKSREMLGINEEICTFEDIQKNFSSDVLKSWVDELEEILNGMYPSPSSGNSRSKPIKQMLSPFIDLEFGNTFIPVLSRIEKLNDKPTLASLIFIPMPTVQQQMEDMELHAVPPRITAIVKLLNMARRFRWDIIEPLKVDIEMARLKHGADLKPSEHVQVSYKRFLGLIGSLEREGERHKFQKPEYAEAMLDLEKRDSLLRGLYVRYENARQEIDIAYNNENVSGMYSGIEEMTEMNTDFLLFGLKYYYDEIARIGGRETSGGSG